MFNINDYKVLIQDVLFKVDENLLVISFPTEDGETYLVVHDMATKQNIKLLKGSEIGCPSMAKNLLQIGRLTKETSVFYSCGDDLSQLKLNKFKMFNDGQTFNLKEIAQVSVASKQSVKVASPIFGSESSNFVVTSTKETNNVFEIFLQCDPNQSFDG